jgi:uncharacterized membrane-anchored protein
MTAALAVAVAWQFRAGAYVPWRYWTVVILVSVVGTLVTDNLTDSLGVPLPVTTAVFAVALAATFALWYRVERTLSIHSIFTVRREWFYWAAYVPTRPLSAPLGDWIAQSHDEGGLGLGTVRPSVAFLMAVVVMVA